MFHKHTWEEVERTAECFENGWATEITFKCTKDLTHYKQVRLKGKVIEGQRWKNE